MRELRPLQCGHRWGFALYSFALSAFHYFRRPSSRVTKKVEETHGISGPLSGDLVLGVIWGHPILLGVNSALT